jgi:hypothetical protein
MLTPSINSSVQFKTAPFGVKTGSNSDAVVLRSGALPLIIIRFNCTSSDLYGTRQDNTVTGRRARYHPSARQVLSYIHLYDHSAVDCGEVSEEMAAVIPCVLFHLLHTIYIQEKV